MGASRLQSLGLILLLAGSTGVSAAEPWREAGIYVGGRGGGRFEDGVTGSDLHIANSASYGAQLSFEQTPGRFIEFWYARQSSHLRADGPLSGSPPADVAVQYLHFGGTAAIVQDQPLQPFVSASLGVAYLQPRHPALEAEVDPSLSLGAGSKFYLTKNAGLRLDGRVVFTLVQGGGAIFCGSGSCAIRVRGSGFTQWEVGAGGFVRF